MDSSLEADHRENAAGPGEGKTATSPAIKETMARTALPPGYRQIIVWGPVLLGLYLASLYSYLLFHSLAEIFTAIIAVGVFAIAWNSRLFLENKYLLFLGAAFPFIVLIDLLHALAYRGMGVFPGFDPNLPTQRWIAARYLQGLSLLLAPLFFRRQLKIDWVWCGRCQGSRTCWPASRTAY